MPDYKRIMALARTAYYYAHRIAAEWQPLRGDEVYRDMADAVYVYRWARAEEREVYGGV